MDIRIIEVIARVVLIFAILKALKIDREIKDKQTKILLVIWVIAFTILCVYK